MTDRVLLPEDPDNPEQWFKENLAFKYNSNWDFLRHAAASSYFTAGHALSNIVTSWQNAGGTDVTRRAERSTILQFNYKMGVSGPLLAATLTPAFALESFARLCAEIGLRRHIEDVTALAAALGGYDVQSFSDRIATMLRVAGAPTLPNDLANRVDTLIEFRNSTVHDTPLLMLDTGTFARLRRGKVGHFDDATAFRGRFPVLSQSNMPLTLGHAMASISIHDEVVDHVFDRCAEEFTEYFVDLASPATHSGRKRIRDFGGEVWTQCEKLDEYWTNVVLDWEDAIPLRERDDFMRGLVRTSQVKLVPDEIAPPG
jgi:hypothetical protein